MDVVDKVAAVETDESIRIRYYFLERESGFLWLSDTMYLCKINVDGKLKWVYLQGIMDDHSRLIVGAYCYMCDNALNFQETLFRSILNYCIPVKLYVDNGSPYIDGNLIRICSKLGITLIHTRSRDGASKGAVERFWRSTDMDISADIVLDDLNTLEQIQACVDDWVYTYNHKVNRGVGGIPRERYEASEKRHPMRHPASEEELKKAFLHTKTRTVRCGVIQQNNVFYELPDELRKSGDPKTVKVFYNPRDVEGSIFVLDANGKSYHLQELDKEKNAGKKRNTGGRTEELKEKAAQKAAGKITESELHAEQRHQRRQEAIRRANAKHAESDDVPDSAGMTPLPSPMSVVESSSQEETLQLDYTTV